MDSLGTSSDVCASSPGGAVLGFDDQVHIDLDRSHTVLSPSDARHFAAELNRIADAVDHLPGRERSE
jgi:hypothetical protein